MEGFGAILGIALAVLFGVSFVRGTIRSTSASSSR